jgi:hypothetical protein
MRPIMSYEVRARLRNIFDSTVQMVRKLGKPPFRTWRVSLCGSRPQSLGSSEISAMIPKKLHPNLFQATGAGEASANGQEKNMHACHHSNKFIFKKESRAGGYRVCNDDDRREALREREVRLRQGPVNIKGK